MSTIGISLATSCAVDRVCLCVFPAVAMLAPSAGCCQPEQQQQEERSDPAAAEPAGRSQFPLAGSLQRSVAFLLNAQ